MMCARGRVCVRKLRQTDRQTDREREREKMKSGGTVCVRANHFLPRKVPIHRFTDVGERTNLCSPSPHRWHSQLGNRHT